jgi:polyphenol oxidase
MIRKQQGSVEWLEYDLLQDIPHLKHGVFLRKGGISEGAFSSLNAGGGTGDHPEAIETNRKIIQNVLHLPHAVSMKQVHGARIEQILQPNHESCDCDGLITSTKHLGLMIKHADCQAAIFYDPITKAIANVHCGWRGNVQNIYAATVIQLKAAYGSNPADLLVCISPSLGPAYSEFIHYRKEFPEPFWEYQWKENYFDLWTISKHQLQNAGVLPHHIEIANQCTYANPQDYFSYRRDKVTGRHATLIALG